VAFGGTLAISMIVLVALILRLAAVGEIFDDVRTAEGVRLRGTLYFDYPEYKLREAIRRRPQLLVLGSSTVMQWRDELFTACTAASSCFYNAGGAMVTMHDGLEFMRSLGREGAPRVLLIGVNFWHLDPGADDPDHAKHVRASFSSGPAQRAERALQVGRDVLLSAGNDPQIRALLAGRITVPSDVRGIAAALHGAGFRADGSYEYGSEESARVSRLTPDERAAEVIGRIARDCCRFEHFSEPDVASVRELNELLDLAASNGTRVVAFVPPMSERVVRAIENEPRLRDGVARARATFAAEFAKRGIPFAQALTTVDLGCAGTEMWDGIHPSEVCDARMLMRLMDGPARSALEAYTTREWVSSLLSAPVSPMFLRPEP